MHACMHAKKTAASAKLPMPARHPPDWLPLSVGCAAWLEGCRDAEWRLPWLSTAAAGSCRTNSPGSKQVGQTQRRNQIRPAKHVLCARTLLRDMQRPTNMPAAQRSEQSQLQSTHACPAAPHLLGWLAGRCASCWLDCLQHPVCHLHKGLKHGRRVQHKLNIRDSTNRVLDCCQRHLQADSKHWVVKLLSLEW